MFLFAVFFIVFSACIYCVVFWAFVSAFRSYFRLRYFIFRFIGQNFTPYAKVNISSLQYDLTFLSICDYIKSTTVVYIV